NLQSAASPWAGAPRLNTIAPLPPGVTALSLHLTGDNSSPYPGHWPMTLKNVGIVGDRIFGNTSRPSLPGPANLPPCLEEIVVEHFGLTELPELPSTLKVLVLASTPNLR